MCLNLHIYQAKASRHRKELTYFKKGQPQINQTIHSQKLLRGHKHKIKGNHPATKRKEQSRNRESTGK